MMKTGNPRRLVAVRLLDGRTRLSIPGSDLSRSGFFDRICWDRISIGAAGRSWNEGLDEVEFGWDRINCSAGQPPRKEGALHRMSCSRDYR